MNVKSPRYLVKVALCAAMVLTVGCSKQSGPSEDYAEAAKQFGKLYGEKWDDAYVDPQMAEVERLLDKVPPKSSDAANAQALKARIVENRKRVEQEKREAEAASAQATAPVELAPSVAPAGDAEPPPPPPEPPAEAPGHPVPGMTIAEVDKRFSDCFGPGPEVLVLNVGQRKTYQMKDMGKCRERHPGFGDLLLVVEDGKIRGQIDKKALERRPKPPADLPAPGAPAQ
jgi:hypothetical protein